MGLGSLVFVLALGVIIFLLWAVGMTWGFVRVSEERNLLMENYFSEVAFRRSIFRSNAAFDRPVLWHIDSLDRKYSVYKDRYMSLYFIKEEKNHE